MLGRDQVNENTVVRLSQSEVIYSCIFRVQESNNNQHTILHFFGEVTKACFQLKRKVGAA